MKPKIIPIAKVWKSEANGWVYHRGGLSPTICCGAHVGCQPKIMDNNLIQNNMGKIYRIRKLTPKECFRLMGCTDSDIDKIKAAGISESQQYKMAGNSIVVQCMEGIFRNLFRTDEYHHDTLF